MLRLLFVGGILLVGIVASLFSRFAALLTYVWYALFRPEEFLWSGMGSLRLSLVVGVLLLLPSVLTGILPNVTHPLSIGTLAFLGTAMVAQLVTLSPDTSWPWLDALSRLVLVVLFAITMINSRRRVVLFIATLAGSIGFHTTKAGFAAAAGGGVTFAEGLGGSFSDNNGYALAAAIILPLLLCTSQNLDKTRPIERAASWVYGIGVPLTILMVIATMSRGGFLAVATGVLTYLLLQRRRLVPLVTVAVVVLVALPFVPLPAGYFDRMQTIRTYDQENEESALSRLHFWQVAIEMVKDNPLGVGVRNYDVTYDKYDFLGGTFGHNRSVHSSHFQVLAELGYLGFLAWAFLFGYAFFVSFRVRAFAKAPGLPPDEARFYFTTGNALIVTMVTFLVGGSFIALALNDVTWYTFAAVAATDRLAQARKREVGTSLPNATTTAEIPEINLRRRATA